MRGVCRGVFVRHCEEERARELRHVAAGREVRGGAHLVLLARCFVFVVLITPPHTFPPTQANPCTVVVWTMNLTNGCWILL